MTENKLLLPRVTSSSLSRLNLAHLAAAFLASFTRVPKAVPVDCIGLILGGGFVQLPLLQQRRRGCCVHSRDEDGALGGLSIGPLLTCATAVEQGPTLRRRRTNWPYQLN